MKIDRTELAIIAIIVVLLVLVGGFAWLWKTNRQELQINRQELQELKQIQATLAIQSKTTATPAPSTPPAETRNPHTQAIAKIAEKAGMRLSRVVNIAIRDIVTRNEGDKSRPYGDPPHIGVGRNLRDNGISVAELQAIVNDIDYDVVLKETHVQNGRVHINSLDLANRIFTRRLTEHDIGLLLTDDLNNTRKDAVAVFGQSVWNSIDGIRKEAILDVVFNLGLTHFKTFVNFIGAVKRSDWEKAAAELLLSEAARENIIRYHRNATVLRTGNAKYFDL